MSRSLARVLQGWLGELSVGPPLFEPTGELPNMVVYPVLPGTLSPDPPDLVTLSTGLRRGVRVNDTGFVSQVHIDNPLPTSVLVGESDLLVGPTQLRSVQFSCLVPPFRRASLPVNCVEAGQPTVYQAQFTATEACPWYVRSFKLEQLARHGESHQHRIWDNIKSYLKGADTASSTHDVRAVFKNYGNDVASLSSLFPPMPGQVGAIAAVGQDLFVELFSDPEILEDRYDQVLQSALVEAVAHPTREVVPAHQVHGLMDELIEVSRDCRVVENRSLRDSGRSLVFSSKGISGSALLCGDRLLHLSAHKRCWGSGLPFADQAADLAQGKADWEAQGSDHARQIGRAYSKRRKRYNSFIESLATTVHDTVTVDEDFSDDLLLPPEGDSVPLPRPLSRPIHEFFVQLFSH